MKLHISTNPELAEMFEFAMERAARRASPAGSALPIMNLSELRTAQGSPVSSQTVSVAMPNPSGGLQGGGGQLPSDRNPSWAQTQMLGKDHVFSLELREHAEQQMNILKEEVRASQSVAV